MIQKNDTIAREVPKLIEAIYAYQGPREGLENRLELLLKTLPESKPSVQATQPIPKAQPKPMLHSEPIDPEFTSSLPPAGIERDGNHCPENSMAQLLAGAPHLIPECLKPTMNSVHLAQTQGGSVPDTFGPEFRNIAGALLDGQDRKDWEAENSFDSTSLVDVLTPLSYIIENAGQSIQYKKSMTDQGVTYENGKHSDTMVRLDMSRDEPFQTKFKGAFHQEVKDGLATGSMKFVDPPSDLVIVANRQIHSENGTQKKVSTPIQDVPEELVVDSELTADGRGALYEISSCIIHSGDDNRGHYTTLRKVGDTWYHIDDAQVLEVDNPEKYLSRGYVFHYRKIETPEITAQEEHTEIEEEASFTCYDLLKSIWASVWKPFEVINQTIQEKKDV